MMVLEEGGGVYRQEGMKSKGKTKRKESTS